MFVTVWEFKIKSDCEEELLRINRPGGAWVEFFKQAEGYRGTEVLHQAGCVLTLDRWVSRAAFESFRDAHLDEYQKIDGQLAHLTEQEHHLGFFESA